MEPSNKKKLDFPVNPFLLEGDSGGKVEEVESNSQFAAALI